MVVCISSLDCIVSATLHSTWKVPIEWQLVNPHARFQEMRGFASHKHCGTQRDNDNDTQLMTHS